MTAHKKARKFLKFRVATKFKCLLVIVGSILILDQWTKHIVDTTFFWGETRPVIESFFSLTYVRNSGAAFGILHRAPAWFRDPFFLIVPLVALIIIGAIFLKLSDSQRLTLWALSLIVGGAIGNLIDRIRFGYVIDFLDFHWKEVYHWPAFNVADSCIVVGVGLMFIQSFCHESGKVTKKVS